MAQPTLDERVAVLESEVSRLRSATESTIPKDTSGQKKGWRWFVGVFADSPEFEQVVRQGEAWRSEDRPQDGTEEAEPVTEAGA